MFTLGVMRILLYIWSVKFSTQHKVIFDQYGVLSLSDSYGDIPGHGVLLSFLGHLVEWTLKSFLILFLGMSFADHKTYRRKGYNGQRHQWAKRFSSCQVYWALFSVVAMSCKFPIREKQSISAICEYKYEGSTSLRFFSIANVSGFRSFDTASFRMLYIHWRGFLAGGSHVLLLRGFQQFYQFLFSFQHSKNTISCLLIISQKLKSFFVSSKYDEGSYNAQHPFSQLRIISIPRCMAKEAVISSSWQKSRNSTIEHFIYSILFRTITICHFCCSPFPKGLLQNLE